jgi:hypothetical protein
MADRDAGDPEQLESARTPGFFTRIARRSAPAAMGLALVAGVLLTALTPLLWPVMLAAGAAGMVAATALWPAVRVLGLPRQSFYYLAFICAVLIILYAVEAYLLIWVFHWMGLDITWDFTFADNAFRVTALLVALATGAVVYRKALRLPWSHALVLLAVHWCILLAIGGIIAAVAYVIMFA